MRIQYPKEYRGEVIELVGMLFVIKKSWRRSNKVIHEIPQGKQFYCSCL